MIGCNSDWMELKLGGNKIGCTYVRSEPKLGRNKIACTYEWLSLEIVGARIGWMRSRLLCGDELVQVMSSQSNAKTYTTHTRTLTHTQIHTLPLTHPRIQTLTHTFTSHKYKA